jgi:hypothetical protein
MSLRTSDGAAGCGECGSPLHADQRYCLQCGARSGAPRVDPLAALGFPLEVHTSGNAPATIATAPRSAPADETRPLTARASRGPTRRTAAALAAATLVLGGVAGAALGPGPSPSLAAAPQRLVALVVPSAPPATTPAESDDVTPPPTDEDAPDTPAAGDPEDSAPSDDGADDAASDTPSSDGAGDAGQGATKDDDSGAATPTTTSTAGTAPTHIWIVSLTQLDAATAFAPTSPLADLVAQGTLLSHYSSAGPSAAANELALLGGQVPTADCAADLAACVLPAGETSLPDQVVTLNLTWRAYVENATARCAPAPNARVGVSLFTTLAGRKDCTGNVVGPDRLAADLATATATPALSLIVPSACHDGSATPCTPGAPAGLDGASAPLHALVQQITTSPAYLAGGVLIIVPDAPPPTTAPSTTDPAATTAPTPPAAAPLGALVLSPRATAGRTIDTATGPVALLRSLDGLLGLDPLGSAAQATTGALDGVLTDATPGAASSTTPATVTTRAAAASIFPHRSHSPITTRRSP